MVQHITYNEFLPLLVGKENCMKYRLELNQTGYSYEYNINTDTSIINSYATTVGQVCHYVHKI